MSKKPTRYISHGLMGTSVTRHTSVKLPDEDMDYLQLVFPEVGMQANLPGALVARFADFLRLRGIKSAPQRRAEDDLCTLEASVDAFVKQETDTEGMRPEKHFRLPTQLKI